THCFDRQIRTQSRHRLIVRQFCRWESSALIQSLHLSDGPEASYIAQAEGKMKRVFIAHRAQCKTLVLKRDAAAIPVVVGLNRRGLNVMLPAVYSHGRCPAEASLAEVPVDKPDLVLIEDIGIGRRHVEIALRNVQVPLAPPVTRVNCARIYLVQHWVVIQRPPKVSAGILHPQARDDGRELSRLGEEGDAG